jgi:antagonist of KipI
VTLRVVKPGILSSLQGSTRSGYARFGVNAGGAMDTAALRLVNVLLGNEHGEAAVEMHFPAASFEVEADCRAALGGPDFGAILNGERVEPWRAFWLRAGDVLSFVDKNLGARAYLAMAGGFDADAWLGSKSTNLAAGVGGVEGRALIAGDVLRTRGTASGGTNARTQISRSVIPMYGKFPTIRVLEGPEFGVLSDGGRAAFESSDFVILPESNRMGFRISGPHIETIEALEMVSSPVRFGTIQLLPSGQMIILMADHQTTGGYPRIANVITHDLPIAAQLSAGDKVAFRFVGTDEAESLMFGFERDIALLRVGSKYRSG